MKLTDVLGSAMGRGMVIQFAPSILKGAMREYLCHLKFNDVVEWTKRDKSLWNEMPIDYRRSLASLSQSIGPLEWLTVDWVIEAGRKSAPSLASLFIGWPEGRAWLERQLADIKYHITGGIV